MCVLVAVSHELRLDGYGRRPDATPGLPEYRGPLWEAMRSEGIAGRLSQAELTKIACVTREEISKRLESLSAAR